MAELETRAGRLRLAATLALGMNLAVVGCTPRLTPLPPVERVRVVVLDAPARAGGDQGELDIVGYVHDAGTKEPIEQAIIVLASPDEPQQERMTDARGAFAFEELSPGTYTVEALAGVANISETVELGGHSLQLNFELDPDNDEAVILLPVVSRPTHISAESSMHFNLDELEPLPLVGG